MMMTNAAPEYVLHPWPTVRQSERTALNLPVTVSLESKNYHGWCTDISQGGLGFTCAAPLEPGQEIKVSVVFEDLGHIKARAIVRHSSAYRAGCEFLFIAPLEQEVIERYVSSASRTARR